MNTAVHEEQEKDHTCVFSVPIYTLTGNQSGVAPLLLPLSYF